MGSRARGALLLFEGVDRCGKTTQARKLVDALNASGARALFMRFPDRDTTIGTMINAYLTKSEELDDRAVHLLFSANRWEKRCVGAEREVQAQGRTQAHSGASSGCSWLGSSRAEAPSLLSS